MITRAALYEALFESPFSVRLKELDTVERSFAIKEWIMTHFPEPVEQEVSYQVKTMIVKKAVQNDGSNTGLMLETFLDKGIYMMRRIEKNEWAVIFLDDRIELMTDEEYQKLQFKLPKVNKEVK